MKRAWFCVIAAGVGAVRLAALTDAEAKPWLPVTESVVRTSNLPCAYAIVEGASCLLIGAPRSLDPSALPKGCQKCDLVLLTHHHRHSCASAAQFVRAKVAVRAAKVSAPWLTRDGVAGYWRASLPIAKPGVFPPLQERMWADWNDLVLAEGIDGVACDLEDGAIIDWRGWRLRAVATPGHSKDHIAYLATQTSPADGAAVRTRIAFCGDALCSPGRIWSPYTCDGHHVNDDGLRAASQSLRKLASLEPTILCPEHGPPIATEVAAALRTTADRLQRAAELKSYERFTKQEIGLPPKVSFLAPKQVGTANPAGNPQPWTRLSPHLYLTGNTYALVSRDGPALLVDAYSPNIVERVAELKRDHGAGPVEVVMISHAHNDHYTGIFALEPRQRFEVWNLEQVAEPLAEPGRVRAPYLDARPVRTHRPLKEGQVARWREYELKIHHLPGQTRFAMGLEAAIDGRRCLFSGDNFYHHDQYTGSGGWSGRNRGLPRGYAASARLVQKLRPDWVLAEHGGAFEYHADDFERRIRWAEAAAKAADALSPSGDHRFDWDPHRIFFEPALRRARPGETVRFRLVLQNPSQRKDVIDYRLHGRGLFADRSGTLTAEPGQSAAAELDLAVSAAAPRGQHVFPLIITRPVSKEAGGEPIQIEDPADALFVLRVE